MKAYGKFKHLVTYGKANGDGTEEGWDYVCQKRSSCFMLLRNGANYILCPSLVRESCHFEQEKI